MAERYASAFGMEIAYLPEFIENEDALAAMTAPDYFRKELAILIGLCFRRLSFPFRRFRLHVYCFGRKCDVPYRNVPQHQYIVEVGQYRCCRHDVCHHALRR